MRLTLASLPIGLSAQAVPIPQVLHLRYNYCEFSFSRSSSIYYYEGDSWVSEHNFGVLTYHPRCCQRLWLKFAALVSLSPHRQLVERMSTCLRLLFLSLSHRSFWSSPWSRAAMGWDLRRHTLNGHPAFCLIASPLPGSFLSSSLSGNSSGLGHSAS